VEIYGSSYYFIRYASWEEFQRGGRYQVVPLDLRLASGHAIKGQYGHPWDFRKYRLRQTGKPETEILIGGAMSPTHGNPVAVWPDDNITRRIFIFRRGARNASSVGDGPWIRDPEPIVGNVNSGWLGHSYGGNYLQEGNDDPNLILSGAGRTFFFYERVSDDSQGPFKTELFARRMDPRSFRPLPNGELDVLRVGSPPYPATHRTIGGYLLEGPRPIHVRLGGQDFYLVGYSSGDFCTDGYGMNFAWSRKIDGPYRPFLTDDGKDLRDFGRDLKAKYGLSWLGRPTIFRTPDGRHELMFHAVRKAILPDHDYTRWPDGTGYQLWEFFRVILKADLEISWRNGAPELRIAAEGRAVK
jgi:hypothetical protein